MAKKQNSFDNILEQENSLLEKHNGKTQSVDVLAVVSHADAGRIVDVVHLTGQSIAIREAAEKLTISTDADEIESANFLGQIKTIGKEAEALRKEKVNPFNELVKRINDVFRPIGSNLETAENSIKGKVLAFRKAKELQRQEEERKRNEEYQRQLAEQRKQAEKYKQEFVAPPPPPIIIPVENTTRGDSGSIHTIKTWKARIVAAEKIPIAYYLSDNVQAELQKVLNGVAKSTHGSMKIEGVEFFQEESLSARR